MLTFVKGTPAEKRLASTFITRFFKHFPKLQDQAIDALLDLCEDEDNAVSRIGSEYGGGDENDDEIGDDDDGNGDGNEIDDGLDDDGGGDDEDDGDKNDYGS